MQIKIQKIYLLDMFGDITGFPDSIYGFTILTFLNILNNSIRSFS